MTNVSSRLRRIGTIAFLLMMNVPVAHAQTGYPMLMGLKPAAATVGETSEHVLASRYNMFGAYQVLVTGQGVTGEVVTPMEKKDGETPSISKLKVKFAVAADAEPGVRDFRVATPQGVSTLGQLVVVRQPVVVEKGDNNTNEQAQEISVPAAVCGTIERAEDVDVFKFHVQAGESLHFHVSSMRLQDKLHDFQQHSDPILSIRSAAGLLLAQSDNHFAGDPFLSHQFDEEGDYLIEIRDVRYHGNPNWEYSIEVGREPFVFNVFPMGVVPGSETEFELVGTQLAETRTSTVALPAEAPLGPSTIRLPMPSGQTNPVHVVVTDSPNIRESEQSDEAPTKAQLIEIPSAVNGRIEQEADVDYYSFDAKKGERVSFEIIARRQKSALDSYMRILGSDGKQLAENDDLQLLQRSHPDSWIENWTAPADGQYTLEIRDLHYRGGPEFVYLLKATKSEPYFELYLDTDKTQLSPGTSGVIFVRAARKNGFQGDIQLHIEGLPESVSASCGTIAATNTKGDGCIILTASADATLTTANVTVTGTADHKTEEDETIPLSATAVSQQEIYRPGGGRSHWHVEMHTVSVGAPADIHAVELSTNDVSLKPGESQRIDITVTRSDAYKKNITLDVLFQHLKGIFANTLPEGVSVDEKNSKTLLTSGESKGHITLKAAPNAAPIEKQQVSVMANVSLNFVMKWTYSSPPLFVSVEKPAEVAATKAE